MKLWRKVRDENGESRLEEITSVDQIDTQKPVLFILPGTLSRSTRRAQKVTAGLVKHTLEALGATSREVETLIVTYDEKFLHPRAVLANRRIDTYSDKEARQFAAEFLKPLQEKDGQAVITLFGTSYGSVFAESVRNSLVELYQTDGKNKGDIKRIVEDIFLVTASDISRATSLDAPRQNPDIDLSGIFYSYANDRGGRAANPDFLETLPVYHRRKVPEEISIAPLTGNRLQVFMTAPRKKIVYKTRPEISQATKKIVPRAPIPPFMLDYHNPAMMILSGPPDTPRAGANLMERGLRNVVFRGKNAGHDIMSYMLDEAPAAAPPSLARAEHDQGSTTAEIKAALAKIPSGAGPGRTKRSPALTL